MKKITLMFFMVLSSLSAFAQLPFESFEGGFPPTGWGIYDNGIGTNVSWAQSNGSTAQPAHTGTYAAYLNRENVPTGLPEDWLVTPQFNVPVNAQVKFWSRLTQGGDQGSLYQLRVSVNAAQAALGNYTVIKQWSESEINPSQTEYAPITVDIPTGVAAVGSQAYLAFVMLADNGDRWLVDDVQVVSKCLDPTTLIASNPTLDGATLSWANPSGATKFEIEIILATAAPTGTGTVFTSTTPSYTATGLQPDTDYRYYVRAYCTDTNVSNWVGPYPFGTVAPGATCLAPKSITSLPYSTTDNTSNYGDDYNGTPGTSGCGTTGSFLNGDDVFYSYTATFTGNISISMTGNGANSGMFVYTSCANVGSSCAAGGTGSATTPVNIPSFAVTSGQTYYIAISTSGTTQSTPYTLIVQQVNCAQPVGQATTNVTATSANLNWTNPSSATAWQVFVQPGGQGIPQGAGTPATTNVNYPATGLNPATLYEYWVRADCGNSTFSAWAGPYTFTTTQVPATMNYTDDFEGTIGWTLNNGTQVNKWVVGTATSNSPTHSLYISNDNGVTNAYTGTTTAVVQAYRDIQLPANTGQISVQFDWKGQGESTFDYVRVWMVPVTFNPTAGTQIAAGTGRVQLGGNLNLNSNWTTATYTTDATAYAGQVRRLVFEWRNDNLVANQPPAAIDNINVALITCPVPTNLAASGVTTTSANLAWTAPATGTPTYDYYVATNTTPPTASTTPTGNVSTVGTTLNNLQPATSYNVWIRANCGPGDTSFWVGPVSFNTLQIPATLNYTDDFEGTIGWTLNNGTQVNKWVVGTATSNSPTHSLYISNDGGATNAYTVGTSSVVQAYRDIQLPASVNQISVQFDWKAAGETTIDYVRVWMVPVNFTPTPGTQITAGTNRVQLGGNLNQNDTWTTATYTTNAAAYAGQQRRLVFEWRNDAFGGTQPPAAIDNVNVAIVTCPAPTALTATIPTSSGATLGWTAPTGATPASYDYYVSTVNTAPVASTTPTGNVTPTTTTLNTLNPNTTYYVWVRSNCGPGDTSFWTGPATFTTLQVPATLNFSDNFEGPTMGWTLNNGTQANKWFYGNVVSNSPTHSLYVSSDNGATNSYVNTTSVVQAYRDITIPAGTTAQAELFFDWKAVGESTFDYMRVWVVPGTYNPTAGTQITTGTNRTQIGGNYNQNANWTTTNAVVNLAPYAGGVLRLVFEWRNDNIISNQPPAAIDNIMFGIPACPRPTNLAVSGITQTGANFTWTEMSDATSWEVLVLPFGSPAPTASTTGTVVNTTAAYSAAGLTQGTQYSFYVRANCGTDDGYSMWAGPISFFTKIANDECATAIEVPVNPGLTCTQTVHGTVAGATQSSQATTCGGTRDDDVWYTFVATATTQAISLENITGSTTDLFHVVYKGDNCGGLTQLYCSDPNTSSANNFIVGQRYYIRIYTYTATTGQTSAFDVCVKTPPPPIAVSTTQYTVPQLVTDVLLKSSTCALVSNFTSSTGTNFGKANGIGYFTRNGSTFGATPTDPDFYHDGIILVTGDATQAPGYNTGIISETATTGWAGDANLEAIIPGYTTGGSHDATYIAFDFTPLVNQISFDFIFASEEYTPAFECDYSDSFAFILKDLTTNVSTNLAVIPSTTTPIQVTNITSTTSDCPANSQYFGGYSNTGFDPTNFNGYTQSMTAQSAVIPGHAYNIKLVVVDDRDNAYNSAVFLRGGSFDPGHVDLGADLLISNNSALCAGSTVTINSQLNPANYDFTWSNSQGVIPNETGPTLTVTTPGTYTLSAALENSLCAATDQIVVEFYPVLSDALNAPQNLTNCNASGTASFNLAQNTPVVLGSLDPAQYQVTYHASQADAEQGINPLPVNYTNATPFQQIVYIRVKNITTQCVGVKSFNLVVQDLTPQFTLPAPFSICDGTSGTISVTAGNFDPAAPGITYTWTRDTQPLADTTPSISVTQAGTYQVTINNSGCTATQTVAVTVTAIPVPDNPADVTACDSYILPALAVGNYYTAANGGGTMMNAGDVINATTTLYVYAQSGTTPNCTAEQDFLITIVPSPVISDSPGNQVACNSYTLPAITVGNYYTQSGGQGTMLNIGDVLNTSQTVYIYAQSGTTPNCTDEESFTVTVVPTPVPDDPADVTSCDSYILPVLGTGNYYTGSGGTGTMLNAGNTVSASQTLYVYAASGTTPNCVLENAFDITIVPSPVVVSPGNQVSCNSYTLPALSVGNYYTGMGGTGTMMNAGDVLTTSQTVYIYAQSGTSPNCIDEESFTVTIVTSPVPDDPADVTSCDSYVLPALVNGNYYTGTGGTGTMLNAGDVVNTTQTLYVYATGVVPGCTSENAFDISIVPSPVVTTPGNQVSCNSYTLPALSVGNYYTGMGGTGTMMNVGDVITTSQTVYVYAQSGTTPNCTDEDSFTVTIVTSPVPDDPADVTSCDSYVLPALVNGNYYTASGGTGTMLNAGDVVNTTQTLYVYATGVVPGCTSENAFDITIVPSPVATTPGNQISCNSYTLPALTVGNYYTGMGGTGTMMNVGDVLTTSQTVYVYAQSGTTPNCTDEDSFTVTIVTSPVPDDPADVTSCDSYMLPALVNGNYYTGSGGTGTMLNAGDLISTTQTLYVYAPGAAPGCNSENSFDITIVPTPVLTNPGNQVACNSYMLPALSAGNYYTGMGGTGAMMNAGDMLTTSQTVYIYAQSGTSPNCTAEVSFTVTINNPPVVDAPAPVTQCDSYVLPALTSGTYYTGPGATGTMLAAGTVVNTTQTLYVYGVNAGCSAENSFTVTIVPTPVVTAPADATECNSYTLPALANGNYYTAPNGGGTMLAAGSAVTSTQTIYVYAQSGSTPNCTAQDSFLVTITHAPVIDDPADVAACTSYTLPALGSGSYYTGSGATGTPLAAGAVINSSQRIYVYGITGSCAAENSFDVTIIPLPVVSTTDGCEGTEYAIQAHFNDAIYHEDNVDIAWRDPNNNLIGTGTRVAITNPGTYHLIVTPAGFPTACPVDVPVPVASTACMIQKGISPGGGDDKNNSFDLTGFGVSHISIFNRYGKEVFSMGNYTNEWHGQENNGNDLPTGTYFYSIERTTGDNLTGWIYINREQ